MTPLVSDNRLKTFKEGLNAGWPICLGYLPIGMAFGVLAQKAGLTPLADRPDVHHGLCRQLPVHCRLHAAGGASAPAIITTTFVVNLRHVLMSSALAVYLRAAHRGLLALFAYGVTDESFAVNLPRFTPAPGVCPGPWWSTTPPTWSGSSVPWPAVSVAAFIPEGALGIDYALIAMFICLLILPDQKTDSPADSRDRRIDRRRAWP
jgi:predicted branched-subunit amino acid permease